MTQTRSSNKSLTQNEFSLTDRSHEQRFFWRTILVLLIAAGLVGAVILFESSRDNDARILLLQAENNELWQKLGQVSEQLERAELDLAIAEVTQQEIERQAAILKEQLDLAREELEFIKEPRK